MNRILFSGWLVLSSFAPPAAIAGSPLSPDNASPSPPTPPAFETSPDPSLQLPTPAIAPECVPPTTDSDRFFVRKIRVLGSTVLQSEIRELVAPWERRKITFEDLLCLRSKITELYISNGYFNSGAFVPRQEIGDGIVEIQVVEGKLERVDINGLQRLRSTYVRSRLALAATTPLNRQRLQTALELLQLDPLFDRVNAELTAGSAPGQSVLIVNLTEAPAFHATVGVDNYRPTSVGSEQGILSIAHDNLLGFGDRFYGEYNLTSGLNFYDIRYEIPINPLDGSIGIRYYNSTSGIIQEPFADFDINSNNETLSFNIRQPIFRTPAQEVALGLSLDLRQEQTTLLGEPFSFSLAAENGKTNLTVLRFSTEWLKREATSVLAARSQLSFGLNAFGATVNDLGIDGTFISWQGQFQWVRQLSPRVLLFARLDTQLTPDGLLSIEQFSLGGVDSVRGYPQNLTLTDNGLFASVEVRLPITADPDTLQLIPFLDAGTGWNNRLPNPSPATLVGIGVGLNWSIFKGLNLRLDYGIPLISYNKQGNSLQENGFYFSLRYRPF